VSFYGVIIEHIHQSVQPDELWLLIGDESRDTTVKIVAHASFDRTPLLDSIGKTILFKHVYVLTASSVFFDDMGSIPSSYQLNPPESEHLLIHFKIES
jgi:hypothetical protein